ncbi:MAG: hypothetical protein LBH05_03350 [Deferribacteraceae bacterium]|nr:hypothetical protein [Deferribacteraceae bacterium]
MFKLILLTLLFVLSSISVSISAVIDLEPFGESYEITEQDFEVFVANRAKNVNFEAIIKKQFDKSFKERTTAKLYLPPAQKTDVHYYTPSYTLQHEIYSVDKTGKKHTLYPVGFVFNPLDYMNMSEQYFIINPGRKEEVVWLKKQKLDFAMVIISEGDAIAFSEAMERPVYVLYEFLRDRLYVRYTPSKVVQEGNKLAVYEYNLEAGK